MKYKIFLKYMIIIFICLAQVNCSYINMIVSYSKKQEGNYFSKKILNNIYIGMNQEEVVYILGTPLIKNFFNEKIWYYVFDIKNKKNINKKKIFILTFNKEKKLMFMQYRKKY